MHFSKEILKGVAEVIVLQVLKDSGPAYGYDLIKTITEKSEGVFEFQEGTLYPLLYRLEEKKLITSKTKEAKNKKIRRYYSITTQGTRMLHDRIWEFHHLMDGLRKILRV